MFVSRSMTRKVITVDPDKTVFEAQELMANNHIRHLPVINQNQQLIGIVTDRDIRSAIPYNFIKDSCSAEQRAEICSMTVKDIMADDPITVSPTYTIQDALLMIQKSNVGALPVVEDDGKLSGILSVPCIYCSYQ